MEEDAQEYGFILGNELVDPQLLRLYRSAMQGQLPLNRRGYSVSTPSFAHPAGRYGVGG